ncbi:hypothetical protein HXA31_01415 [Salipaludibacillus agaradhaerens]|uniref:Uncharacterized protein n=1 Tax=Salipaludibacillus agaradhaerens TaxID=76935 RepID=A0A9Q4B375_SALAG|nr:hypothetical protein [Salipaludibacillus agaradhaerens]MCR6097494.1 hypothetical protein [Salipaludibacillus agaradhaerens]MCR6113022.1 hypothetical protein [Salipaludibacillus agaradhaerens]
MIKVSCCPEPQLVVNETCNTYNTDSDTPQQIFEHGTGVVSGYVTLQNFNASGGNANVSTDAAGTNIIATAAPDNSYTVFVPSLTDLYVFSETDEVTVLGIVKVSVNQTVRPQF